MSQNKQPTLGIASWFEQGLEAQDNGHSASAIDAYLQVLQFEPNHFAATYNLATLYHNSNQMDLARHTYIDAIRLNPTSALPYKGLGDILFTLNDIEQAYVIYNQALKIAPDFAEVWNNLGIIEQHRQNFSNAFNAYRKAVELRPDYKSALESLIKLDTYTGKTTETIILLTDLSDKFPHDQYLKLALAEIFYNHHQSEKALNLILSTLAIDQDCAEAFNLLGLIHLQRGEAESARLKFKKAHNLSPYSLKIHSNLLYSYLTDPTTTPDMYRLEAKLWWRLHGAPLLTKRVFSHQRSLEKNRVLRLGFISGDFHHHSVSFFFLPLLENLAADIFETFCYSDSINNDDYTDKIITQSDHWRPIHGLSCEIVTQMIAADKIDILVELSGHTANNRLPIIAQKPAPVQFSWLGYPASTGIANGTFRLTDKTTDPKSFQKHYSETLTYLRSPFLCYASSPEACELTPNKKLDYANGVVFASFNNAAKLNQNVIEIWSQILGQLPNAKLLLKTRTLKDVFTASQLKQRFASCGISPKRIEISSKNYSATEHFLAYNQVDIALDPFPYNGTTTTCDALWMGTPVICLCGKTHANRVGTSLMQALGCPELIAATLDEYVDKAVSLARNPIRLTEYHRKIRPLMQNSSLMNGLDFAKDFSRTIMSRWEEWRLQRISLLKRMILENRDSLGLPQGIENLLPESSLALTLFTKGLNNNADPYLFLKLGQKYVNEKKFSVAYECFREAVAADYNNFAAHFALAHTLQNLDYNDEALHHYRAAIDLNPKLTKAAISLSKLLFKQNKSDKALTVLLETRNFVPDDNGVNFQLATIYYDLNKFEEAYEALENCLKLEPKQAGIWNNLGYLMAESGNSEKAAKCYRMALSFNPKIVESQTNLIWHLAQSCAWKELETRLKEAKHIPPLLSIILYNDLDSNLRSARNSLQKKLKKETFYMSQSNHLKRHQENIIKIGYLSCDFRDHPVAHNIINLFRLHDRSHFHITAYSCGIDDSSSYRHHIRNGCDNFVDLQTLSDQDSAKKIHADGIHILIELMGHTRGNRLGICAFKPAPIQLSYLGYPGTTGAPFVDYLIADEIVIPQKEKTYYSENIIYLPHCFMIADRAPISPRPLRSDYNLPEDGFIFCSFNSAFKIEPIMFKVWMDILNAVPKSFLWLRKGSHRFEENLRHEALQHGIDPKRLIFAARVQNKQDHLARLQLADLALDTRIYNGHTTTLDALWSGVPVITSQGSHFASRVSESNLRAIKLAEMITPNLTLYKETAVNLAQSPKKLKLIRHQLESNRLTTPLFNTLATTKLLEKAYSKILSLYFEKQKPTSFKVDAPMERN